MEFSTYQDQADRTNQYPSEEKLACLVAGLASESGEVCGKFKKSLRDEWSLEEECDSILAEVGDVLWYVSQICTYYGVTMTEVAEDNLKKLKDRNERGVIKGSGDNR